LNSMLLDRGEGWGGWRGTPVGDAAIAWKQAAGEHRRCLAQAEHAGWRAAHGLRRQAKAAAEREGPLREQFQALAAPARTRLETELPEAKKPDLEGRFYGNLHFQIKHPEALRRLDGLDTQIATVGYEMDVERQGLDGIPAQPPQLHQRWSGLGFEREAPGLEPTIERGFGLEL
jgi:hypothetical protein